MENYDRYLGRLRPTWEDYIKTDLNGVGCNVYWIHLVQNRNQLSVPVKSLINLRVP
jgi:hypothetical protein